ncbi:MAG: histidinol dehydrogenase [Planctomycetaceae bacterium]|nr:histidinol dehydrogenase [Planctomycetaceae bacterium]
MLEVKPFSGKDRRFLELLHRADEVDEQTLRQAAGVIETVRSEGSEGLLRCVREYDSAQVTLGGLRVSEAIVNAARTEVSEGFLTSISLARVNARKFHEYQRRRGYVHDDEGVRLSRQVRALGRVGICCGDSFAALLLHAVPAQIAGVDTLAVAASPREDGTIDPRILATAKILGIDEVYAMSGAQAVAAFAFGAGPVRAVDKVVGPGGAMARAAKLLLSGRIGVDGATGRGELMVVADDSANAKFIATDLLAQSEWCDDGGLCVLATSDRMLAQAVRIELDRLAELLPNGDRIRATLKRCGAIYAFPDLYKAVSAANELAPARLNLVTRDNQEYLSEVMTAGAVFLGPWSADVAGGYFSGANPYLRTGGASAHAGGLGVDDFVREMTVVEYGPDRFLKTGRHMAALAEEERLPAHAEAVRERLELLMLTVD